MAFEERNPTFALLCWVALRLTQPNAIVLIDPDGSSGKGQAVNFITVSNVSAAALNNAINFAF